MTMTPQDIQSQQFHVRFRGFDVEEVDAFLERVAEEFLLLVEENKQLAAEVESLKKEIDSYHHQEKAFQSAILSAQQISEEMKAKSRREAEEITAAAREEARQLHEEANAEIAGLEAEVDQLKQMKQQVSQELRHTLQNYLDRLDKGWESPLPSADEDEEAPQVQTSAPAAPTSSAEEPSAEESAAEEAEGVEENPVVDLSDLYEKVELTEDELAAVSGSREGSEDDEEVPDLFAMEVAEETEESTIPDLEGDMLFSLEDPLDEEGPEVSFEEEAKEEEDRKQEKE